MVYAIVLYLKDTEDVVIIGIEEVSGFCSLARSIEGRGRCIYIIQLSIHNMRMKAAKPPWRSPFPAARKQTCEKSGLITRVTELQSRLKAKASRASYIKVKALVGRKGALRTGMRACG